MKSFKEIMAKVAMPPLADHPQYGKHIGYFARKGVSTPVYERTPGADADANRALVARSKMKTAGVSDDLDRDFVSWMEAKAGEDVVKTAAPSIQAVRRALEAGKVGSGALEEAVQNYAGREKLKSLLKGTVAGGALTAGAGALYLRGRRDQRAKTAGVIENQDNLDLLELIKKRVAAGAPLGGDV